MARILIADDEKNIRLVLKKYLQSLGHTVYEAKDGREALEILEKEKPDLAFLDIKMPVIDGIELLSYERDVPKVILTAYGTMDYTIKAIDKGAIDYITKPFELEDIKAIVDRISFSTEKEELDIVEEDAIIGSSKKMQEVFKLIGKVARTDATVLIIGESGTGKELVARAIHKYSRRSGGPFVAINCAALPTNLLEAELFGYEKGAFTGATSRKKGYFEQADGGTLFLDEIGEIELSLQSKLLRAIQEKEIRRLGGDAPVKIDVRIVAATNRDLEKEVKEGRFREDLFYRLNVLTIELPPLRERKEDIVPLALYFIKKFAKEFKLPAKQLTDRAKEWLCSYDFPGNVRELENMILKAMLLSPVDVIDVEDLQVEKEKITTPNLEEAIKEFVNYVFLVEQKEKNNLYDIVMKSAEKILITEVLKYSDWNQVKAARTLGIHRNTLRTKIKELGIEIPRRKHKF
ncbi:sigma-54-dependent transcriptional regulator [Desulfurobacterium atlanticum]|uniref:Two component, sigma54 specific, transcriptional regulator, Fis family n=1 Tax=Desulfurobacterium atlanticum TaxID=240169 RepID=A0A238Z7M9_9BACT|nr:sigma-54 dependent transcriptional regulator [Desulfurobacterium atlanticum]SNR79446.1 two component, sigma54 specific, transcriptional regulator, Fis family [Desulfurobacterium atlanticum]